MKSPTLALLEEAGIPLTRENYLNLAFLGNAPNKLDAEEESELPAPLQDAHREMEQGFHKTAVKKEKEAQAAAKKETIQQSVKKEKDITPSNIPDITIGGGATGTEQLTPEMKQKMHDQRFGPPSNFDEGSGRTPEGLAGENETNSI